MRRWASILALLAVMSAAAAGAESAAAAARDLVIARRALGDGLWETAVRRAVSASAQPELRVLARKVQLEALARAGRDADLLAALDAWGPPEDEASRYWRARAYVRTGRFDLARAQLARPFAEEPYAALAVSLAARLAAETADRPAAEKLFAEAARLLDGHPADVAEHACEWARALDRFGDVKAALEALKTQKALEADGPVGDAARLLGADLMARAGDAASARRLRTRLIEGGERTWADAFVRASASVSEEDWSAGRKSAAMAVASNAVARANTPALARRAGFVLGFQELATPSLRTNGLARIAALVRGDPGADESRTAQLRLADELLRMGDNAGALREYDLFLQAYPKRALDVHVLEGRGWAFHGLRKYSEAVGAFARAAQVATNDVDRARCSLKHGDELLVDGRFSEAAAVYATVTQGPFAGQARFQQADALARDGQDAASEAVFRAVLDGGGRFSVQAGLRLAAAEAAAGRTEKAIADYNRVLGVNTAALSADPDDDAADRRPVLPPLPPLTPAERAEALYGRGRAYYRVYRFDESERDFAAVAELQPARVGEMKFLSALCRYGAGRDDEAYAAGQALLRETPDSALRADLVLWLAKFDFSRRDFVSARTNFLAYTASARATPARRLEAYVRAARCAQAQSEQQDVLDLVSHVLTNTVALAAAKTPSPVTATVAEAMILQGEALIELTRFDEAVLVLERVVHLSAPDNLRRQAAVLKADCLFAMGADNTRRYEESLDAYRAVLQDENLPPSTRLAVAFKIGRTLEKLGPSRAEDAMDQYYTNVVMAYLDGVRDHLGFDASARAFFARAVFILADRYESRGEDFQAARVLGYLVATGGTAAEEARKRIARLKKKGGF